jgi:MscS family membrane protein
LASLGITGVAVALGAQETLKNYFGTLAIFMDETFRIGDWVKTTDVEGTVEKIGLRSTYIRQFDKALVSVPNGTLTGSAVVNFSKMTHRRVRWIIGIRYDATAEQLENIVNKIRAYLEKNDDIETDLDKVVTIIQIDKFGESAIDIFCYFFTKTTKWLDYMKVKEECVLSFKRIVTEEGTDFALPSRSLYIGTNQSEDLKKSA